MGNSVGLRLSKPLLEQVGLTAGSHVDVLVEGDHLVIRGTQPLLADLLAQCRPDSIDLGPFVGRGAF